MDRLWCILAGLSCGDADTGVRIKKCFVNTDTIRDYVDRSFQSIYNKVGIFLITFSGEIFMRIPVVIRFLCVGASAILAAGCGASLKNVENETLLPEIDVVQVKEYSEEALKLAQEAKIDVQMINTRLADIDHRLVALTEEVSSVSLAKIEELENRLALLIEAFKDLHEKMASIEVLPQIRVGKKSTSPVFSPSDASSLVTTSEYDQYQKALRTYDGRIYDKAVEMFSDMLQKYPEGSYRDKAQYWIGECHYAKGDYASAIAAFNRVSEYPKTSKADDAQLKLGLSYLRMGKNDLAAEEFKRLINRYPASEYVPRAEKYLAEISK
jgi:tol-pal system protein YbgF